MQQLCREKAANFSWTWWTTQSSWTPRTKWPSLTWSGSPTHLLLEPDNVWLGDDNIVTIYSPQWAPDIIVIPFWPIYDHNYNQKDGRRGDNNSGDKTYQISKTTFYWRKLFSQNNLTADHKGYFWRTRVVK